MAAARTTLLKTGIITDVGLMSLIVTLAGVVAPLVLLLDLVTPDGAGSCSSGPQAFRIDRPAAKE